MSDWRSYDATADVYERIWAPRFAEPARDLVAHAELAPGMKVLDVATGTGIVAAAVADAVAPGGLIASADRSPQMMRQGLGAGRPGLRSVADVVDLPFRDGTFDAVTCGFAMHIFGNHQTALFEMIRVLRPGGCVAFSSWGEGSDEFTKVWQELVEGVLGKDLRKTVGQDAAPGSDRFADADSIEEILRRADLRKPRIERREYRFRFGVDEFVDGLSVTSLGRFTRQMLGDDWYASFLVRVRGAFRERFTDPLTDFNEVWLSVAVNE